MKMNLKAAGVLGAIFCLTLAGCSAPKVLSGSGGSGSGSGSGGKFKLRPYKDVTLKNGLKVVLIEDKTLPYLSLGMLIKVGGSQDPQNLSGLNDMVAELLDKGTRQHSALELSDLMAQYGGEFNATAGIDATYASASALSFHQETLLGHFAEIITEASFRAGEIERLRRRRLAQLKQVADDPDTLTEIAFEDFLYGQHPYARPVSGRIKDVRLISKKHITKHYLQYYRPSNSMLAVVGKFSPDIVDQLERVFAKWTDRKVERPALTGWPKVQAQQVLIVDKGDLQQAQIRFGHKGIRRNHRDFIALRLANAILGGGFSSRLMTEVRVKRGLTYSVSSGFDARLDEGPFEISTFTRHDKIGETIKEVLRVVEEYQNTGPSDVEIKEAKALLKGQFPRTLETPDALASNLLHLRFYGVPDSYLSTYLDAVEKITAAALKRVIKEHFQAKNLQILVHAPRAKALPQIEGVAPVQVVPYGKYL
jgi:zinc protease